MIILDFILNFSLFAINFLSNLCSLISPWILIPIKWFLILWICLWVIFLNLWKSLISQLNLLSDLIEFQRVLQNTLILHGFDPYSPLYYLIRDYFSKFASLDFILTRVCVFNDRVDSLRHALISTTCCHTFAPHVHDATSACANIFKFFILKNPKKSKNSVEKSRKFIKIFQKNLEKLL